MAPPYRARQRSTMSNTPKACERTVRQSRAPGSAAVVMGLSGIAGRFYWSIIATLLVMVAGAAAHPPEAKFAD